MSCPVCCNDFCNNPHHQGIEVDIKKTDNTETIRKKVEYAISRVTLDGECERVTEINRLEHK